SPRDDGGGERRVAGGSAAWPCACGNVFPRPHGSAESPGGNRARGSAGEGWNPPFGGPILSVLRAALRRIPRNLRRNSSHHRGGGWHPWHGAVLRRWPPGERGVQRGLRRAYREQRVCLGRNAGRQSSWQAGFPWGFKDISTAKGPCGLFVCRS